MAFTPFAEGIGMQGQCMHRASQFFRQQTVNGLVAGNFAFVFKICGHDYHLEVGLGVGGHVVLRALIEHLEVIRAQGSSQFRFNSLLYVHGRAVYRKTTYIFLRRGLGRAGLCFTVLIQTQK